MLTTIVYLDGTEVTVESDRAWMDPRGIWNFQRDDVGVFMTVNSACTRTVRYVDPVRTVVDSAESMLRDDS